jgi:NADPH-dependent 2,4-dienoyl-CoA reductase/sulfur reductase-like enzyme
MESTDPDIYAVGDAAETTHMLTGARTRIPLAGPANRQGRIAGANAAGGHFLYPGALETFIVRILDRTAGFTGLNGAHAAKAGFSFFSSVTVDPNHSRYYPGSSPMRIKIIAEDGTGRLLSEAPSEELGLSTSGAVAPVATIASRGSRFAATVMDAIEPKTHNKGDRQPQRRHPDRRLCCAIGIACRGHHHCYGKRR